MADLLYSKVQMSGGDVDALLDVHVRTGGELPFSNHNELHAVIDGVAVGDVPWESFTVQYNNSIGDDVNVPQPKWKSDVHEVFYRDPRLIVHQMLANPGFKDGMDFAPYRAFDQSGSRRYEHPMSGDWAWNQSACF
jgi:Plavaka transposase